MVTSKKVALSLAFAALALSFGLASAASALTTSCVGTPTATNITWTASSAGGIAPIAFLWGNGSTSATQVIAVAPGTYTQTIQATDASSTVATSTCSATVVAPLPAAPTITSFVATPATITVGQSSVLSWVVANASSTSIDNSVGTVSSTSITVTPAVTTTYVLSAINPGGTTTASATITVNPVATSTGGTDVSAQIKALLAQIEALKAQILQLVRQNQGGGNGGTGVGTTTAPTCMNFGFNFKRGHRGDDVREMQMTMASTDPSILPRSLVTGFFGKRTEEAMRRFQRKFGCMPAQSMSTSTRDWGNDSARDAQEGGSGKNRGGKHDN